MSYAKLFSSITESSLWSEPKEVRLLFVSMLAKADAAGFIEASVPGLARVSNLTIDEVQAALTCLESPDPHSKNPTDEGRRLLKAPGGWMLLNYEEYRNRRSDDERREYMRKYMSDYRKQRKQSVNSVSRGKPPLAQAEAEAEAEAEELNTNTKRHVKFTPPSVSEVAAYCTERKNTIDSEHFVAHYTARDWVLNNGRKMKCWKSAVITWEKNRCQYGYPKPAAPAKKIRLADDNG